MIDAFSLHNKKILVTGASSGIGKIIAEKLSEKGATLTITGRNELRLRTTLENLNGESHQSLIADLTNSTELQSLAEKTDRLDGVVFCAGIVQYMPVKHLNLSSFDEIFDVNFKSQIALYQQLHSKKKISQHASLVFISSISAVSAVPATLAYATSKAAINSAVRILASELSKLGVRVNSISPGLIETPLLENTFLNKEVFEKNAVKYPLGPGKCEDVANAVIFLLSDASRWITGTDLIVDGGYMLRQ
ncbi:MAG: SDR family NAD(P)-dependent oxidoreductase [Anaerolineaceae bacterium]|nr:SDR family NAD(P)-dependent oxidoreductase [Clostridia bacterium]MDD4579000.1 SDR family NAD(P)-dependent oxidoreductase [Anaerolineaceae bacterium]